MPTKYLLLSCVLVVMFTQPSPPWWGGRPQYKVEVLMTYNKPVMTWNFSYFYDSILKAERYEHRAPQAD